jgi:pilus assembly protein CpaF
MAKGNELADILAHLGAEGLALSSPGAVSSLRDKFSLSDAEFSLLFGQGPLQGLLEDETVTEILVNGPEKIWAERGGLLEEQNLSFPDSEWLKLWVRRVLSEKGRKVDHSSPFADCILADGSRLHVALPPISQAGLCLSLRKFSRFPWSLEEMETKGSLTSTLREYLRGAVRERKNIFVCGGTGSGKTSLLSALLAEANRNERLLALEDVAEIRVDHPHFLSLEARPANQEGLGEVSLHRLLREALRMRPDRLVIGECRGTEAFDVLMALNTGHAGSMGTIHANSPRDALRRLETLALLRSQNLSADALRSLIVGAVQVLVQVERGKSGRRVSAVAELKGSEDGRYLLREIF